ncbi:MAG: hypothetical protein COW30_02140 [Rhodospirillales bacterium CG15_BIG_FIL_POST_REV_8_21_14_020_66_15]|nr:MAG: hypothetical protein COW30_02140 [Rhodospirillales bacterium CG15_BIG_FIL_POST_REV_8_21_14_020_66_15]
MGSLENGPTLPPAPSAVDGGGLAKASGAAAGTSPGLPGVGGTDGFGGFGKTFLSDGVGRGQANRPEDVGRVSGFLTENGILKSPARDADEDFFRAIETGQDRLNELAGGGLRRDGIVKPWGPTEMLSQRAVSSGRMRPFGEARADTPTAATRMADAGNGMTRAPMPNPPRLPPVPAPAGDGARVQTRGRDGPREETPLERKTRIGPQGPAGDQPFHPNKVDPDAAAAFMRRLHEGRTTVLKPEDREKSLPVTVGGYRLTRESSYLLRRAMTATAATRTEAAKLINKSGLDRTQKGALHELITRRLDPNSKDPTKFVDRRVVSRLLEQLDERTAQGRARGSTLMERLFPAIRVDGMPKSVSRQKAIGDIIRETIKKSVDD